MGTNIEWADETWNVITGCTKISPGCKNCYAERMAKRLKGRYGYPKDEPFRVTPHIDKLDQPLHWRKPRMVFVCSMGDLFHPAIINSYRDSIMEIIAQTPQHTYQILTKRPGLMQDYVQWVENEQHNNWCSLFPHVWLGVSAEDQERADERIPSLLKVPAAVRFVSVEPMLGPVNLSSYLHCGISWCIIGAESGPNHRPMSEDWVRGLIAQCKQAKVPVFYKQAYQDGKKVSLPMIDGRQYIEYPQITGRQNAS